MPKAYVETTALTDALLKPGPHADAANSAIKKFEESQLPAYAIKEMKAGPLRYYVWLHGKLATTGSLEQTLEQLHRMAQSPRRYWASTAVEGLRAAAKKSNVRLQELVQKYGNKARIDSVNCDLYKLSLHSIIMRGWKRRQRLTTRLVDELECYAGNVSITEERGLINIGTIRCQPKDECSLAAALKSNPEALKKLKQIIEAQPAKRENERRLKVLKELIRVPKQKLDEKNCRRLGDAIFAFFCPQDACILTTNVRDLRPLAEAFGKSVESPADTA